MEVTDELLREIAEILDEGEVVYLHKTTLEMLTYPDSDDSEFDYLKEEVREIVFANPDDYVLFEPPTSHESYRFMEEFAISQPTDAMRARLLDSLQAKRPFRAFRDAIEWNGLLDDWYISKQAQLEIFARDQVPD